MIAVDSRSTDSPVQRSDALGAGEPRIRTLDSQDLLGASREVRIRHQGESYTLRLTRLGKLILTK